MEAQVAAAISHDVLVQIERRNKLALGFKEIIEDYQRVLRQSKEQAVRPVCSKSAPPCIMYRGHDVDISLI